MFWVWVCLGVGLICVEISMVVGIFVGRFLGVGDYITKVGGGGLEVVERLILVRLVVVGRG